MKIYLTLIKLSNMTGEIPDKEKRKRKGGGNKSKEEKEANKELRNPKIAVFL